jgi:hypothetical protein
MRSISSLDNPLPFNMAHGRLAQRSIWPPRGDGSHLFMQAPRRSAMRSLFSLDQLEHNVGQLMRKAAAPGECYTIGFTTPTSSTGDNALNLSAIKRFQENFPGIPVTLASTGQTFAAVAAERVAA